jgi:hypothetical protein
LVSILAVSAAIGYYFPWYEFDSIQSGKKRYPLPGGVSSGGTSLNTNIAFGQKEAAPDKPESTSPLPPREEGEGGPPISSSAPSVSSDPSSSEKKSPVPSAIPPQETQAVKAEEGEKPGKDKSIAKEPAPPKKMEPPSQKDFFAIKIMMVRDPQNAQEFMESQKKRGFDIHSRTITIKDQGLWHQIFWGHFGSQEEAKRFLDEKKIGQSYPGSVIMKLPR